MHRSADLFVSGAELLPDILRLSSSLAVIFCPRVPAATKFDRSRPADSRNSETLGHAGLERFPADPIARWRTPTYRSERCRRTLFPKCPLSAHLRPSRRHARMPAERRFRPFAAPRSSRRSGPPLDLHDRAAGQAAPPESSPSSWGRLLVLWYRLFTIPIRAVLAFEARWTAAPNEEDSCRCRRRNPRLRLRAHPDGHSRRHFCRAFAASTNP